MVYPIVLRILLWILVKPLLNVLFIPVFIYRMFQRSHQSMPITDTLLLLRASELAEKIRTKEITAEIAVKAYISRVKQVNPLLNAVIYDRFEVAIQEAQKVDAFIQSTDLSIGQIAASFPLLGLPLTVKGSIDVKGLCNTGGLKHRSILASKHARVVQLACEAGAIPILTSNVPELCMNWETKNKLIGRTRNPYDSSRTVGGSSGGECALLASGGSLIGLGSDIAGSLRLPAHFCGVWGHKPSPGVVSCEGHYPDCQNRDSWNAAFTLGPLARYATDLRLLLNTIMEREKQSVLNLDKKTPWNSVNIFYLEQSASILAQTSSGETVTAFRRVVNFFRKLRVAKCEPLDVHLMRFCSELSYYNLLKIDNVDNLFDSRGSGAFCELARFLTARSDHEVTSILYGVLRRGIEYVPQKTDQAFERHLTQLRQQLLKRLGSSGVLVLPTFPTAAHCHGDAYRVIFDYGPLSVFNALGFPVTSCPVAMTKNGLPIGIQVVAAPNCDRLCLQIAEELETAFGGWKPVTQEFQD